MALNINTNITNNLDGYLLDAKNVKGTYVVVANYSELANLPSACVVNGSLAYVSEIAGGMNGFYQYDGSSWIALNIKGSNIYEFTAQSGLDYSQTYNFTLSNAQFTSLLDDWNNFINGKKTTPPSFNFKFPTSDPETFSSFVMMLNSAIGNAETFVLNQGALLFLDNKTYTANLTISLTTLAMSLSFQELQAGSGGGGTTTTKKWLKIQLEEAGGVNTQTLFAWIDEEQLSQILARINQQMSTNLQTKEDLITFYNSKKNDDFSTSQQTQQLFASLCMLFGQMVSFSMKNNKQAYFIEKDDGGIYYPTISSSNVDEAPFLYGISTDNFNWFNIDNTTSNQIRFSTSSTLTITEEEETIGGGLSSGGGSGKLYELSMELTRYDENGDAVTWGGNSSIPLHMLIYESNWEKIKNEINNLLPLIDANAPQINTINDLVTMLNAYVIEQTASASNTNYIFISTLINYCDKVYARDGNKIMPYPIISSGMLLILPLGSQNNTIELVTIINSNETPYGLNVNNSCTLTEYGTSGGGGGASATRTKYHIEVEDSNGNKAIIPIYQDTFEDYLVEFNQVGQTMATAMGVTWTTLNNIAEFKTLFDTQKATQYAFGCDLGMNLLVKYAYESGENPLLVLTNSTREQAKVVNEMLNYDLSSLQIPLAYPLGAITSVSYDPESIQVPNTQVGTTTLYWWFKATPSGNSTIEIDQDATFTYTEEQVAGGSSGGEVATKKWYNFEWHTNVSDGSGGTLNGYYNTINATIDETAFNRMLNDINSLIQTSLQTPQDLIALYNSLKSDDFTNATSSLGAMMGLVAYVCNEAIILGKPAYRLQVGAEEERMNVTNVTINISSGGGWITTITGIGSGTQNTMPFVATFDETAMSADYTKICFDANSTLTITEETETISGGSSSSQPTEPYTQLANDTPISATTVTITVNDITNYDFVQIGVCNGTHWLWQTAKRSKLSSEALLFQFGNDTIEVGISGTSVLIIPTNATIYEYDIYGVN